MPRKATIVRIKEGSCAAFKLSVLNRGYFRYIFAKTKQFA